MIPSLNDDIHTQIILHCATLRDVWALLQTSSHLYSSSLFWKSAILAHVDRAAEIEVNGTSLQEMRRVLIEIIVLHRDILFPPRSTTCVSTRMMELGSPPARRRRLQDMLRGRYGHSYPESDSDTGQPNSNIEIFCILAGADLMITTENSGAVLKLWDLRSLKEVGSLVAGHSDSDPFVHVMAPGIVSINYLSSRDTWGSDDEHEKSTHAAFSDEEDDLDRDSSRKPTSINDFLVDTDSDSSPEDETHHEDANATATIDSASEPSASVEPQTPETKIREYMRLYRLLEILVDYRDRESIQFTLAGDVRINTPVNFQGASFFDSTPSSVAFGTLTVNEDLAWVRVNRSELRTQSNVQVTVIPLDPFPSELGRLVGITACISLAGVDHLILWSSAARPRKITFWHSTIPCGGDEAASTTVSLHKLELPSGRASDASAIRIFPDRTQGIHALLFHAGRSSMSAHIARLVVSNTGSLQFKGEASSYSYRLHFDFEYYVPLVLEGLRLLILSTAPRTDTSTPPRHDGDDPNLALLSFDPLSGDMHVSDFQMPPGSTVSAMFEDVQPSWAPRRYAYDFRTGQLVLRMVRGSTAILKYK